MSATLLGATMAMQSLRAEVDWTGLANSNWFNSDNWSIPPGAGGTKPPSITGSGGAGDAVFIEKTSTPQPVISSPSPGATAGSVTIGNTSAEAQLTIQSGGTLALGYMALSGQGTAGANTSGSVLVTGAGSNLQVASPPPGGVPGGIVVGQGGSGTLTVSGGATLGSPNNNYTFLTLGYYPTGSGVVTITGNGSQFNSVVPTGSQLGIVYQTTVGSEGAGTLSVTDGAAATLSTGLSIGTDGGTPNGAVSATVNVSGVGSTLTTLPTGGISVGANIGSSGLGGGALNVTEGGNVTTTGLSLSTGTSTYGSVTVDGAGSVLTATLIGMNTNRSNLVVSNGGTVNVATAQSNRNDLDIGGNSVASSTVSVTGTNSTLTVTNWIGVSCNQAATPASFTVAAGGKAICTRVTASSVNGGAAAIVNVNSGGTIEASGISTLISNGTLKGAGVLNGALLCQNGAVLSPGDNSSPGTLTVGSTSYQNATAGNASSTKSILSLWLPNDPASGTPGTNWSQLAVNGTLDVTNYTLTLSLASFTGDSTSWNGTSAHTWSSIVTTTGGITGFTSSSFTIDTTGFNATDAGFTFSVVHNGNNLDLVYGPLTVTTQPQPQTVTAGQTATLTVAASTTGAAALAYQWQRNGAALSGEINSSLTVADVQPANAGLYTALITTSTGNATSDPAIVGVATTGAVIGSGSVIGTDILHPNGNHFDQVLVTGPAESLTAGYADNRITRTSYIDLNDDIVQVEFAGHGTLSLVLENATGPAVPLNYNQPGSFYMKGQAGIVIVGADETTNVSVFTVGRATAFDPTGTYNIILPISATNVPADNGSPLFAGHDVTAYDGTADIAFIAITSTDGKFGGLRAANANFLASQGVTGLYAPGVQFTGPVYIGNIDAFDTATPVLQVGAVSDARITGGDLYQDNRAAVQVSGLTQLKFTAGSDSQGNLLPAQENQAVLEEGGQDVTALIVVNPP